MTLPALVLIPLVAFAAVGLFALGWLVVQIYKWNKEGM